jgi:hypothetical protein
VKCLPAWGLVSGGWQLSRALQGRLRRDGAIVELTVNKSSVAGYSAESDDVGAGS